MQFKGQGPAPPGIVFDADLGNSIDDALALAMLYTLDGKNEIRMISVSVSKSNLHSAAYAEVLGGFYSGAVSGAFGAAGRNLPVGMANDGHSTSDTPMLLSPLQKKKDDGSPAYASGIEKVTDTAEVSALIRNAFTSQKDGNCRVVLAGPATNLVRVMMLPGAKELIERKVSFLAFAGGSFPSGKPEAAVLADIAAAKTLFAEWPTPIVAAGSEIGNAILFPAASIEADFAWSPSHPVVDAYRAYEPMPYDAPTTSMAAALYAARHDKDLFQLSPLGEISVSSDGITTFKPSLNGKHRYLTIDPEKKEAILRAYTELASAKPIPRQRFRFPQKKDEKPDLKEEAKPDAKVEEKPPAAN